MKQLSLVSFIENKPDDLTKLIINCQDYIRNSGLNIFFRPYLIDQVHATIIGLEMINRGGRIINKNYLERKGVLKEANITPLVSIINSYLPGKIQIGGFNKVYNTFKSFGKTPWERSFGIDLTSKKVYLMGWMQPFIEIPMFALRKKIEDQCFIAHKYKEDNDFYFVLGELEIPRNYDSKEIEAFIERTCLRAREYLSENQLIVDLSEKEIYLVKYYDTRLPAKTTEIFPYREISEDLPDIISKSFPF